MNARAVALRGILAALLPLLAAASPAQTPQGESPAVLRERAAGLENRGQYSGAADLYLQLVALDPGRAEWVLAAGNCLGLAGRFNDAIDLLTAKRPAFPGLLSIPALLARTHLLHVERDPGILNPELSYQDAVDLATEVLQLDPDHEDARLILAQARYGQGDTEGALEAAQEAVRRHPQRAGAQILVGRIAFDHFVAQRRLLESGDVDKNLLLRGIDSARKEAQTAFGRAADLEPGRSFARMMLGQIAAIDRDEKQAFVHWGDALAIDPTTRVDHTWIGTHTDPAARRAFYQLARERHMVRADADAARAATLTFYEAMALYAQQQWQQARELFAQSRRDNPAFTNADYYGAMCAWRLEDHDGAEELAATYAAASAVGFADVLRGLQPEQRSEVAGIVRFLGDRAYKEKRVDHSRDLNHVIACLLDSADAWNNYAFLCRETGRFEEGYAGYQHAIEKEPDSPQLWNDAAVILQYDLPTPANAQKAREMYRHAIELADKTLAEASSSELARDRAKKARDDAEKNLAELR